MTWRLFRALRIVFVAALLFGVFMSVTAAAAPSSSLSFDSILAPLAVLAGSTIGAFVIAVLLDDVAGVVLALRQKKFAWNQLPSFVESEFGSQKAAALLGLVVGAVASAAGAALIHSGLTTDALRGLADAAFAAATAGAAAMMLSVISDLFAKVAAISGGLATPNMGAPKT